MLLQINLAVYLTSMSYVVHLENLFSHFVDTLEVSDEIYENIC